MAAMALRVRTLTPEEQQQLERLAHSRTAPVRLVERAQIVWYARHGERIPQIAQRLRLDERTARLWLKRFNEEGFAGLEDRSRSGRPATYAPEVVAAVLATAVTDPRTLGLPFACWTVRRLEAYLNEEKGLTIKRSRIDELLLTEGLRWRTQETWFGERASVDIAEAQPPPEAPHKRLDPEFIEKRGRSSGFTRPRRQRA
jgi:transposase